MNTLRSKRFLSIGFGLLAALGSWTYLYVKEAQLLRRGKMLEVLSAKSYLPAYTHLQAKHLQRRQIPAEYVPKGAVTEPAEILGQMTLVPFSADEVLTYNKLAKNGQSLANAVPEGRRAFTLGMDKVHGLNGLLRPGDLVDLLFSNQGDKNVSSGKVLTLLQNIQVLAAGDLYTDQADKTETGGTVTLALTPEESELVLLASTHGTLHLTLRSNEDTRVVALASVGVEELLSKPRRAAETSVENFVIKKR